MANDIFQSLKSEGALAGRGEFKLDGAKARQKMEQFQLANPYRYVLELVQAAVLLGARRIDFDVTADEMTMSFDGDGLSREELTDIYSAAFSRDPDDRIQARRHIAIALTAIGAIKASEVRVIMRQADGGRLELARKDGPEDVHKAPDGRLNVIYVKEAFRFSHLMEFFELLEDTQIEAKLVRRHCAQSTVPVFVNGEQVSKGHHLSPTTENIVEVEWEGERGLVGVREMPLHAPGRRSVLKLVQNGVLISEVQLGEQFVAIEGVFETSRLTKNLSQSAFVEDETFAHLMNEVIAEAAKAAMSRWVRSVQVTTANYTVLREIALSTWDEVVAKRRSGSSGAGELATALETLPIWPIATQLSDESNVFRFGSTMMTSLRALKRGGPEAPVDYSEARFHAVVRDEPVFLADTSGSRLVDALTRYTRRPWRDVAKELEDQDVAARNRIRWRGRPWQGPHKSLNPIKATFEVDGLTIEIYGERDRSQGVMLMHVHDDHVLNSGRIPETLGAAKVVIRGSFQVNSRFEAPMRTPRLKRAYMEIVKRLPEIWLKQAADEAEIANAMVRTQLGIASFQLLTGTYLNFSLRGFGFPTDETPDLSWDLSNSEEEPPYLRLQSASLIWKIDSQDKRIDARLDALGPLATAPIVPCSDARRSMSKLVAIARQTGTMWTGDLAEVGRQIGTRRWRRGPIVDENHPWGTMMRVLFEETADAVSEIEAEASRDAFLKRPLLDVDRVLNPSRHVILGQTSSSGWTSRWGLRDASAPPEGAVYPLVEGRLVERIRLHALFDQIDVVVHGAAIELHATGDRLASRDWLPDVSREVDSDVRAAVAELASKLAAGQACSQRETVLIWSMMQLAHDTGDSLVRVPFVRDTQGGEHSVEGIREMAESGSIHWVTTGHSVLQQAVKPGARVLVLPTQAVLSRLAAIAQGSRLVECNATEQRERELERARARFYARRENAREVPFSVATGRVERAGRTTISGLLAVDQTVYTMQEAASGEPTALVESTLSICREWRQVEHQTFRSPLGSFHVLHNNPELRLDEEWTAVAQDTSYVLTEAKAACEAALVDYLDRVLETGATQPESIRKRVFHWLVRALKSDEVDAWEQAWERIARVPLFMGYDGKWRSYNDVVAGAQEGTIAWVPKGRTPKQTSWKIVVLEPEQAKMLDRYMVQTLVEVETEPLPVEATQPAVKGESRTTATAPMRAIGLDEWGDTNELVSQPARIYKLSDEGFGDEVATPASPEEKLLSEVKALMSMATRESDGFLPRTHMESLVLWGNDPKRVARVKPDTVSIAKDHPVTAYATDAPEDPVRRAFLASAVMTALNHHYEEIADSDEIELQRALLENWNS